jgi:hypothetical protein
MSLPPTSATLTGAADTSSLSLFLRRNRDEIRPKTLCSSSFGLPVVVVVAEVVVALPTGASISTFPPTATLLSTGREEGTLVGEEVCDMLR